MITDHENDDRSWKCIGVAQLLCGCPYAELKHLTAAGFILKANYNRLNYLLSIYRLLFNFPVVYSTDKHKLAWTSRKDKLVAWGAVFHHFL